MLTELWTIGKVGHLVLSRVGRSNNLKVVLEIFNYRRGRSR